MEGRDRREDAGQYYPGGRVVPKTPTGQGGGGTSDYDQLANRPKINNHELIGNKTAEQLGLASKDDIPNVLGKLPLRALPKYLHCLAFDDTYPADAAWLYAQLGPSDLGRCSAVRRGGKLWRNYDWTFDFAPEFVVPVSGSATRFASVGVASVGSLLTENDVMSAVNSPYYKCLPGMTLDGINEKGVVCEINVDGGPKTGWHGDAEDEGIHILAAVRWVLDHGETAAQAAEWIADHIIRPQGEMNFHFMVADATSTYIVENGEAHLVPSSLLEGAVLTNYALYDEAHEGGGKERYTLLAGGADIKSVWFTNAYQSGNTWDSDFDSAAQHAAAIEQWAAQGTDKEAHRGKTTESGKAWWQSVHTTEYDFAAKTMKVAVQEVDDWYVFAVDQANVDFTPVEAQIAALQSGKRDKDDRAVWEDQFGPWIPTASDGRDLTGLRIENFQDEDSWFLTGTIGGRPVSSNHYGDNQSVSITWPRDQIAFMDTFESLDFDITAARTKSLGQKDNQQLAAVATGDEQAPANNDLVKYDAENDRFVKAVAGADYLKTHQDISGKADRAKTLAGYGITDAIKKSPFYGDFGVVWNGTRLWFQAELGILLNSWDYLTSGGLGSEETLPAYLNSLAWRTTGNRTLAQYGITDAAKLAMLLPPAFAAKTSGSYEEGEIVLYNNAAYKRNDTAGADTSWVAEHWTAATDADLAARLKMLKSDGTATDDFATDLLGKPVAKDAISYAKVPASDNATNRSIKVYSSGSLPASIPLPEIPSTGIIDLEVWIETADSVPAVTFSRTVYPKDGKALEFAKNSTNIVHLTAVGGAIYYTAVAAAFAAETSTQA